MKPLIILSILLSIPLPPFLGWIYFGILILCTVLFVKISKKYVRSKSVIVFLLIGIYTLISHNQTPSWTTILLLSGILVIVASLMALCAFGKIKLIK